jgi:hypothetical protein
MIINIFPTDLSWDGIIDIDDIFGATEALVSYSEQSS